MARKTYVLTHCVPQRVYPPNDEPPAPPAVVLLVEIEAGGMHIDGAVRVHMDGCDGPFCDGQVDAGDTGTIATRETQEAWIHYIAAPEGPETLTVECECFVQ